MQITFEALERALAPIEEIGKEELTFPCNGIPVTLRILVPEEETEVHRYSSSKEDEEDSLAAANAFLERLKIGVLSYAIVAVNDEDFHGVDFVETGEELKDGKKVRVPKYKALRDLLKRWPGAIRAAIFRKYVELLGRVEAKAEAAIEFEPSDTDAEIERVEARLKTLKEQKEAHESPVSSSAFSSLLRTAEASDKPQRPEPVVDVAEEVPEVAEAPEPVPAPVAAGPRQPIIPNRGNPPVHAPAPVPVQEPAAPPAKQPISSYNPPPPDDESIVDLSDPDAVEQAMARETARLMARRRGIPVQEHPTALGGTLPGPRRVPPHLDAF